MDRKYNIAVNFYVKPAFIPVVENCNGFTFTNTGDTTAYVNGMVIYPGTVGTTLGDSRSIGGNEGEIYGGVIKLAFDTVAPGTNPQVEIVQKFYIEKKY